jgi:hypothetical protein
MDSGKSSAFLPEKLAFGAPTFLWPCNLPQERYYFMKPVPKKEIPVKGHLSLETTEKGPRRLPWACETRCSLSLEPLSA